MISLPKSDYSKLEDISRQIRHHCSCLTTQPLSGQYSLMALERIRQLLEFIPIASADFSVAGLRIGNARRYLQSGEFGAARYEIRLLLGILRQVLGALESGSTNSPINAEPFDASLPQIPLLWRILRPADRPNFSRRSSAKR